MNVLDRFRMLVEALPSPDATVTFTRADIARMADALDGPQTVTKPERDLTVPEVAEETQRATSTVRGWLIAGDLRGYKLNNRDWRVPRSSLREFLVRQDDTEPEPDDIEPVDISAWRKGA